MEIDRTTSSDCLVKIAINGILQAYDFNLTLFETKGFLLCYAVNDFWFPVAML